jgi:uncharacterized membrane protein YbhN (UPF0104 family)
MSKRIPWRPVAAVVIVIATVALFVNYFIGHPSLRHKLAEVPVTTLIGLLFLYCVFVYSLSLINMATVRLCKSKITQDESLLLSAYSSVINFFGPLQSGPAFRGVYLKAKHGIKLRDYTLASFTYYFFYALFSGLLLVSAILKWWTVPLGIVALVLVHFLAKSRFAKFKGINQLALGKWHYMALATALQILILSVIFYIEIRTVAPTTHFSQALIYTGAANFALFVSLTPGAIGFREAFLVFSQNLHHINNATIVAANTIDRAVYIVLLGILAIFIFGTHARNRFQKIEAKTSPLEVS